MRRITRAPKPLAIRLLRKGCANRPFYHIVAAHPDARCVDEGVEKLGVYDPMPNEREERLLAVNIDRFKYYVAGGAWIRSSVAMLLGSAGVLPLHPHSLVLAWRNRQEKLKEAEQKSEESSSNKS